MPPTYTTYKEQMTRERRLLDFDPNTAAATVATLNPAATEKCLPIATFRRFLSGLFKSVGTGTVISFKIIGATAADGTGNTAIVTHALASNPDAVGDYVFLEVDAEQIREVMPTATHVGVEIALTTSTDECVVLFERCEPFYGPTSGLTAEYVS